MAKYNIHSDISLSHNFIVYYWMNILCADFKVSEGAKNLYALIFAFTKDGKHKFTATQKYVSEMLYCSVSSIKRYTAELEESGLINKGYAIRNDTNRVEMSINESVLLDYFGCGLKDLYSVTHSNIPDIESTFPKKSDFLNSPKPIIMDFSISRKNGIFKSSEKKQQKETKAQKDNKYIQFIQCLRDSNYSDAIIDSAKRYIKWLLGNRKLTLEQWQAMVDGLNKELLQLPNKAIREQAAIDTFNSAFANGYRKLSVDKFKFGKNMQSSLYSQGLDTQKSNTITHEVSKGVYEVVPATSLQFVRDESGNIIDF